MAWQFGQWWHEYILNGILEFSAPVVRILIRKLSTINRSPSIDCSTKCDNYLLGALIVIIDVNWKVNSHICSEYSCGFWSHYRLFIICFWKQYLSLHIDASGNQFPYRMLSTDIIISGKFPLNFWNTIFPSGVCVCVFVHFNDDMGKCVTRFPRKSVTFKLDAQIAWNRFIRRPISEALFYNGPNERKKERKMREEEEKKNIEAKMKHNSSWMEKMCRNFAVFQHSSDRSALDSS